MTFYDRYPTYLLNLANLQLADNSPTINNALIQVAALGGGVVRLPAGVIALQTPILHYFHNVKLIGAGCGADGNSDGFDSFGTTLLWTGGNAPGTYVVDVGPRNADTHSLQDPGFYDIHLNGNGANVKGIRFRSCRNGEFKWSTAGFEGTYGTYFGIAPAVIDYSASQFCNFKAYLFCSGIVLADGGGFYVEDLGGALSFNYLEMKIEHKGHFNGGLLSDFDTNKCRITSQRTPIGVTTITSPATPGVVTHIAHGLVANDPITFKNTGGNLPAPIDPLIVYYVLTAGLTANTFRFALTPGGAAINTTGAQAGTQDVGAVGIRVQGPTYDNNQLFIHPSLTSGYAQDTGAGINNWLMPDYLNGMPVPSIQSGLLITEAWPEKFKAHRTTTSPNIPTGVFTAIVFDVEDYDLGNVYNNGTGVFTAPFGGYWDFHAQVDLLQNGVDVINTAHILSLFVNGAEAIRGGRFDIQVVGLATNPTLQVAGRIHLTVGQTVDARYLQTSGGNRVVNPGPTAITCIFDALNVSRD